MKIKKELIEHIRITIHPDQRKQAFDYLYEHGYTAIDWGPKYAGNLKVSKTEWEVHGTKPVSKKKGIS